MLDKIGLENGTLGTCFRYLLALVDRNPFQPCFIIFYLTKKKKQGIHTYIENHIQYTSTVPYIK